MRFGLEEYEKVMDKTPSWFAKEGGGKERVAGLDTCGFPVETVSWTVAQEFCAALTRLDTKKPAGWEYTLPTEAEWEYAGRAGTQTAYSFGDDPEKLGDYAWFSGNSGSRTHEVGGKKPNSWGLYDMHGNVWQWCLDSPRKYEEGSIKDPKGDSTERRVLRGGSWSHDPLNCRAAFRCGYVPGFRTLNRGFRVVLGPGPRTP